MKTFDRIEYNKMCAEFLGGLYSETAKAWGFGNARIEPNELKFGDDIIKGAIWAERFEKDLKFDSDWNWIMEIKNKIDSLYHKGFHIVSNIGTSGMYIGINKTNSVGQEYEGNIVISNTLNINYFVIEDNQKVDLKEAVVQAIWEFLNWYKENKL